MPLTVTLLLYVRLIVMTSPGFNSLPVVTLVVIAVKVVMVVSMTVSACIKVAFTVLLEARMVDA